MHDWLRIAPEVRDARAVVALESTIITHGMPYPENLATAQSLEREVQDRGVAPATIRAGPRRVGATRHVEGRDVLSRADLPYAVISLGLAAAAITVESTQTVAPHLTSELVYARLAAYRS
jgi:pseudouridine-5'-phosphate glycosidase